MQWYPQEPVPAELNSPLMLTLGQGSLTSRQRSKVPKLPRLPTRGVWVSDVTQSSSRPVPILLVCHASPPPVQITRLAVMEMKQTQPCWLPQAIPVGRRLLVGAPTPKHDLTHLPASVGDVGKQPSYA
jgi:hypothetical protein